ncbi:MAG TPA: PhoH family protein, partial [Myxococcales bacterium]|nr:PhoH family protein [Myxococcales bacterium]
FNSKAVVTGDVTQVDLPAGRASGLQHAREILRGVSGIEVSLFTEVDVVRHPLVQEVIKAYDRAEADAKSAAEKAAAEKAAPPPPPAPPDGQSVG